MKKVLVIDDDTEILNLIRTRLQAHYEVILASDGEAGLQKIPSEKPDLILLDIKMPQVDGFTFLRRFKRLDEIKRIPIIVLTAYVNMKDLFEAEGITDYILKPFDAAELLQKIASHLDAKEKT